MSLFNICATVINISVNKLPLKVKNMKESIKKKILSELNRRKKEIYSFGEILDISGSKSANSARVIISRIVKDKRLISLKSGTYLYIPEGYQEGWTTSNFWIGANIVDPYAISFWSALNHWGLTEQIPNTTYIQTTKSVKKSKITMLNSRYQIIRLTEKRFFGIVKIWVASHQVNITDPEKTLADCLAFPQYCGGISEAVKGLYNFYQTNQSKNIISYARKMGQPALKRLGYLLELLEISNEDESVKIKSLITNPNSVALEPLLPTENSEWNSKWKLNVNITNRDLLNWKAK